MFHNYLLVIFRNLWRNKTFAALNIAGLSIGIAACLLILLYVQHELSYDRFNTKADRMVRVTFRGTVQGEKMNEASVMPPVAQTLKADYPEVEEATRLRQAGRPVVLIGEKSFRDNEVAYADANFFEVFTLPFVQGDAKTALQNPNCAVLSAATVQKFFGTEDPIGKVLHLQGWDAPCTVTGVMQNIPLNAHFQFDLFVSMAGLPDAQSNSWMTSNYFTYLVLQKGYDYKRLEAKLPQVLEKYLGPQMQQAMGLTFSEFRSKGNNLDLLLQPLTDIHLGVGFAADLAPGGNIQYIYIFSAVALFILLIACINFMNLSTAAASRRAREVGIRKVMGSAKGALVRQFMIESLLLTLPALCLATGLLYLVLPVFNTLINVPLSMNPFEHPWLIPGLLAVGLVTGILAGTYPAFFLSSFQPIAVLKGRLISAKGSFSLRSGLVVFQFGISITLILSTLVVYKQLSYIQNKELGYQKEQVLILPDIGVLGNRADVFRNQLAQDPRVQRLSTSGYLPAGDSYGNNHFVSPADNADRMLKTLRYDVDEQYIPTLGMEITAGRNFSKEFGTDSAAVILNESAVKAFGFEKDPIGRIISHTDNSGKRELRQVIGVVKDFHFRSLHEPISPLVMELDGKAGNIIVKARASDFAELLAAAKAHWAALNPHEPFVYSFLDERFEQTYHAEQKTGLVLGIFAGLTIFVACLGLFGLAMFTAGQRRKEIGVRKVLGAGVMGITRLLATDFLKLVVLAVVMASPLAYWIMNRWLADFAYRIDIQAWMFGLAGLIAVVIAFFTVAGQALKAAVENPVESLRSE